MVKESAAGIADAKQAVQAASAHGLELPKRLGKGFQRQGEGEGLWGWEQLTDIHLTDWW